MCKDPLSDFLSTSKIWFCMFPDLLKADGSWMTSGKRGLIYDYGNDGIGIGSLAVQFDSFSILVLHLMQPIFMNIITL